MRLIRCGPVRNLFVAHPPSLVSLKQRRSVEAGQGGEGGGLKTEMWLHRHQGDGKGSRFQFPHCGRKSAGLPRTDLGKAARSDGTDGAGSGNAGMATEKRPLAGSLSLGFSCSRFRSAHCGDGDSREHRNGEMRFQATENNMMERRNRMFCGGCRQQSRLRKEAYRCGSRRSLGSGAVTGKGSRRSGM